jgi:tol-pal system protein YbgF
MMSLKRTALFLSIMTALTSLPVGMAHAGILNDDEARKAILELRDTITELDRQSTEKLNALNQRLDDLNKRLDGLQKGQQDSVNQYETTNQNVDKLRGVTEELHNDIGNTQKRDKDRYNDIDARLRKLEPAEVTIDGHGVQIARDEQSSYDTASGQFKQNNFQSAIRALTVFAGRYPLSVYAPDAQYFLGLSYYAIKDYPSALTAHQFLIEHYPDSPHVADALLNMAACQVETNEVKSARETLLRITADYPNSDAARLAKLRLADLPADKEKDKPKAKPKAKKASE